MLPILNYLNTYVEKKDSKFKMSSIKQKYIHLMGRILHFNIKVMNAEETVKLIKQNHASVIRLGDGEFDLIAGKDIPYQKYDPNLGKVLKQIVLEGSSSNNIVCLPDVFNHIYRYTKECRSFYFDNFFYQNRKILRQISKLNNIYGSTFISRPYIDLIDKSNSANYFESLKLIWKEKDILIVEGSLTRSGEGNDLFSEVKSIKRIICPAKNAFYKKDSIEKSIKRWGQNRIVLLMLGPTAKVVVNDLKEELPNQLIDLGHVDTEYEWFKRKVTTKTKIPHKHTAEFNNDDEDVTLVEDSKFDEQVVEIIK